MALFEITLPTTNRTDNLDLFLATYTEELERAIRTNPQEYRFDVSQAPEIARKMTLSLARGAANKDGQACKATCKRLGIPHNYKSIEAYLAHPHEL